MNSLALNGARTNRQCGRSIILEEIWFQYFFSHLRVLDKKLCHREFCLIEVFSFLQFAKGLLREKIIPPSHSRPCMAFPQLLSPDRAMEELAL